MQPDYSVTWEVCSCSSFHSLLSPCGFLRARLSRMANEEKLQVSDGIDSRDRVDGECS